MVVLLAGAYYINRDSFNLTDPNPMTPLPVDQSGTPSPMPPVPVVPEDWESYSSEAYNFIIRYPEEVTHETTTEGEHFFQLGPSQAEGTELYDGISVHISAGSLGDREFDMFVAEKHMQIKNDPTTTHIDELKKIMIAGKNGYAFTTNAIGNRRYIYLPKEGNAYLEIIDGTVEPTNRKQTFKKTVETMLSSLLFE